MASPLITYILFAYNQEHYVREAIEAAFAQTYSPLEIILSDDGSRDGTFEVMREMAAAYRGPHTLVLNRNEPNLGIGGHVNKAFAMAKGEWIVTAAGDDISDPERCSYLAALMREHPQAGAIGTGWRRIDASGAPLPSREMLIRYRNRRVDKAGDPAWIRHYRRGDFGLWGMSVAWRTEMLRRSPLLPPEVMQEDEVYSFFCALLGYDLLHCDVPLVSYREHERNVSGRAKAADFEEQERQKVRVARMRAATLRFLAQELAEAPEPVRQRWTEQDWNDLARAVGYRLQIELEYAEWWNFGFFQRLRRLFFPARSEGRLAKPRGFLRVLPYSLLKAGRALAPGPSQEDAG
jgi:glycosyltransferase involved in cell wall biosynthesis